MVLPGDDWKTAVAPAAGQAAPAASASAASPAAAAAPPSAESHHEINQ